VEVRHPEGMVPSDIDVVADGLYRNDALVAWASSDTYAEAVDEGSAECCLFRDAIFLLVQSNAL